MAKRHEIHAGVQGEGRQAVDRVARLVSVGDQGDRTGRQGSGGRGGDIGALARQDGRHGRVRVPQDARPVVGAGPGSGRDRLRPGDERHAGIGNPQRAPRQDARRRQTGEGHGRRARPRGTRVRGGVAEPAARGRRRLRAHGQRLVRPHGVRRRRVRPHDRRPGVRHRHGHRGLPLQALEQAISWAAPHGGTDGLVHRSGHGARCIGLVYVTGVGEFGMPPPDRHGRRLVRQHHSRERRRRVQDRARLAAQALPGFKGPEIGDVPADLVAGTRSVCTGPWATGHRNGPKPGIMQTKRRKPPHYKGGTKIRPYRKSSAMDCGRFPR